MFFYMYTICVNVAYMLEEIKKLDLDMPKLLVYTDHLKKTFTKHARQIIWSFFLVLPFLEIN